MNNKKEVVVFHDLAEVEGGENTKTLVWIGSQTFTIEYLDEKEVVEIEQETNQTSNNDFENQSVVDIRNESHKLNINKCRIEMESERTTQNTENESNEDCQARIESIKQRINFEKIQNVTGNTNPMNFVDSLVNSKDIPGTVCAICKKNFSSEYVRKRHMLSHFGIKPYRCDHCLKHFSQSSSYYAHKCTKNPTGFNQTPTVGPTRARCTTIVYCHICGKMFRGLYMLRRHETVHTGERPYKCEKCHRTFSQWIGKNKHCCTGFVDSNFISYACTICSKAFKNEKYLLAHQQLHYLDAQSDLEDFPESAVQGELNEDGNNSSIDFESSLEATDFLREIFSD